MQVNQARIHILRFNALLVHNDYAGMKKLMEEANCETKLNMLEEAAKKNAWEAIIIIVCEQEIKVPLKDKLSTSYLINACQFGIPCGDSCENIFEHLKTIESAENNHKQLMNLIERRKDMYYNSDLKFFKVKNLIEAARMTCLCITHKFGLFVVPASNRILELFVLGEIWNMMKNFETVIANSKVREYDDESSEEDDA